MIYKLHKNILNRVYKGHYDEFCQSLSFEREDEECFYLGFEDRNYKCMPLLSRVLDSGIQAIGMFSGAGGLDIGAQLGGAKIISSMDFNKECVVTMQENAFFSHASHFCEDIRNVDGSTYDTLIRSNNPEKLIVIGGPPCQPFSKAGYWITNERRQGINDERNMVGEYLRVLDDIRPDGFLLENVESILHPTNREIVDFIEERISSMGYKFIRVLANAMDYGIPQKRKRVIFLASLRKRPEAPAVSREQAPVSVLDWIGKYDSDDYFEPEEAIGGKTYEEELRAVPPGKNYIALSEKAGYPEPRFIANKRFWNFLLKLHPSLPSWTIAAQPGPWVGPFHWNNRRLRMREIASIQTFPEDYRFVGSRRIVQRQIGNAVPSLLGKIFVEQLIKSV